MRSILVTRPQPVADEFADTLRREGYTAYVAPLMEYVEVNNEFDNLSSYQAFIFTSAQAVQFFCRRTTERNIPVLAVGDATAAVAARYGFTNVYSADGDADDVTELLLDKKAALRLKKVLHPCSQDTPGKIDNAVAAAGIKVVQKPIYKAKLLNRFPDDIERALQHHSIDTVTLFSSRSAENLVKLLKQREMHGVSAKLEAICISDRVADNLVGLPWRAVRVARRPQMDAILDVLKHGEQNRRSTERRDRRQHQPQRDDQGHIQANAYTGPDRRSGIDRRAYEMKKQERVLQERVRFVNNALLTFAFVFGSILIASFFLMAPEYGTLKKFVQKNMVAKIHSIKGLENVSLGGMLNTQIEQAQHKSTSQITADVLAKVGELRTSPAGYAAVEKSMKTVRELLAMAPSDPGTISNALDDARQRDPTLNKILNNVVVKDLAAAGMLLALSEFRTNVSRGRPYGEDIAMLQRFVGNDPGMQEALARLAPYAQSGIIGREALSREFNGFTKDILMAALSGQDLAVKQRAFERFTRLSQAVRTGDIRGQAPEAVMARAQVYMKQGDIMSAIQQVQTLNSAAVSVASPWLDNASGYAAATPSSDVLTRGILQAVGGGSLSADQLFPAMAPAR